MSVRLNCLDSLRRLSEIQQRTLYGCLTYGKAAGMKLEKDAKRERRWAGLRYACRADRMWRG